MPEPLKFAADHLELSSSGPLRASGGRPKTFAKVASAASGLSAFLNPLPVSAQTAVVTFDPDEIVVQRTSNSVEPTLIDWRPSRDLDGLTLSARDVLRRVADMQAYTQSTVEKLSQQVAAIQRSLADVETTRAGQLDDGSSAFDHSISHDKLEMEVADWLAHAADAGDTSPSVLDAANKAIDSEDAYTRAMASRVLANTGPGALGILRAKLENETNPVAKRIIAAALHDLEG